MEESAWGAGEEWLGRGGGFSCLMPFSGTKVAEMLNAVRIIVVGGKTWNVDLFQLLF